MPQREGSGDVVVVSQSRGKRGNLIGVQERRRGSRDPGVETVDITGDLDISGVRLLEGQMIPRKVNITVSLIVGLSLIRLGKF